MLPSYFSAMHLLATQPRPEDRLRIGHLSSQCSRAGKVIVHADAIGDERLRTLPCLSQFMANGRSRDCDDGQAPTVSPRCARLATSPAPLCFAGEGRKWR